MGWLTLLAIALGLAMDAFAVSIATGLMLERVTPRHTFRIAFHFGLFQFLMPVIGWCAGSSAAPWMDAWDHWAAFGLLSYVGGRMLWEARKEESPNGSADPTRGWMLITLSVATSIDALAVGFTLALVHVSVWVPSVVIGLITAMLSSLGIIFGARLGPRWGRGAQIAGGVVLVLIGVQIIVKHFGG